MVRQGIGFRDSVARETGKQECARRSPGKQIFGDRGQVTGGRGRTGCPSTSFRASRQQVTVRTENCYTHWKMEAKRDF
jgi:hypothetical protein